ncbi:MAG: hypothetical protein M3Q72_12475, partial [Actinomycetota bacterium]|nr:hypothetical protein [Actinomycetota bacterium]
SEGACATSYGGGATECGAACVDTMTSPAHCGGCDMACPAPTGASGLCMAGTCRAVCDDLTGDCNADRTSPTGNGCETPLATDPANCGACGRVCTLAAAVAGCDAGACVIATCDAGFSDCDASDATGCEAELATDVANCGACGNACAAGSVCLEGACVVEAGEDCSDAFVLAPGANTVRWTATMADYLMSVSCTTSSLDGPDVVLSYTAVADERVTISFDKPASTRWAAIVSTGACGILTPETTCMSEFTGDTMSSSFLMTAGQTAYVYVRDTTSGALPLDNPLSVDLTVVDCTAVPPVTFDPPNGSTSTRLSQSFTATFGAPIISTVGTVTLTGTMGTALSYDLGTAPAEVTFDATNTVMTIDPGISFPAGEVITLSWTGLQAVVCTTPVPVPAPTWQVTMPVPPCSPGVGGVVGTTLARVPTGLTSIFESYLAADTSPTGYVYFGGTASLYRIPKAGGTVENLYSTIPLATSHVGYAMVIDGLNIFTIDSTTSGTTGHIIRISADGGTTFMTQLYATFPTTPGDDFRGATISGGRMYLVTHEFSSTAATEIWSVDANAATVPATPVLERTIMGEAYCSGIVRDSLYYYTTCGTDDRLVRVPVAGGGAPELITDFFDLNSTVNALHGEDLDADDIVDVLYVQGDREEAGYVCDPSAAAPFVDRLFTFGTGTSNYGMGFDRVANVLWMIDDDTRELVSVQ